MRGTIQQRGERSWRIRAYVGQRYVSRTVHGTRRDAERDLSRLPVEVDEGRHVASPTMTLDGLLDRWLHVKRQYVQPGTDQLQVGRPQARPARGGPTSAPTVR